jgi:formylglycine-generating enzyme required for sulfatase activity
MSSRIARALGITSLGILAYLGSADSALAGSHCAPGTLNASGTCDCPGGFKNVGGAGNAHCEGTYVPPPATCGVPGKPDCPKPSTCALPGDAGSTVAVKGGAFTMGDSVLNSAGPTHTVTLQDFQIDKYEVTAAEYKKCVDAGVCSAPPAVYSGVANSHRCNYGTTRSCHPMNCVTYLESTTYCQWKGKRLPTEAEWEYAARGKTSTMYPWGTAAPTCEQANFSLNPSTPKENCGEGTAAIGKHAAGKSGFGVHDMAGNVEEWAWDWYANYSGTSCTNPGGPLTGTMRVAKGSAWDQSAASDQQSARREGVEPTKRESWLGFRCAMGAAAAATPTCSAAPAPAYTAPATTPTYVPPSVPAPSDLGAMIKIPAGTFKEGNAAVTDSAPERTVTLSPYFIDKYEVTAGEYKQCVTAGSCLTPLNSISPTYCNYNKYGKEHHPVNCVEWSDAKKYCSWAGKRLPTESEWEFAARGTDGRTYPWGSAYPTCSHAAFKLDAGSFCSGGGTSLVGTHALGVSYWGIHDMAGNIEEWTYDNYAPYTAGPLVNPSGPISGTLGHVVRGGNWEIDALTIRTYSRYHFDTAKYWIGFRCARTAT